MGASLSSPLELPAPKATPGDTNNLKRYLDEYVVKYFEESTPFREDLSWGNMKMAIMIVSCVAALVSQFYPLPFPENRMLLGVCVVIYFLLSGVLQFMVTFLDRDVTYRSLNAPPGDFGAGGRAVLRTSLPKGQATYTLIVELPQGHEVWTHKVSIGNYYTSTGTLVPERVKKDVESIVESVKRKVNRKAAAAGPSRTETGNPVLDTAPTS